MKPHDVARPSATDTASLAAQKRQLRAAMRQIGTPVEKCQECSRRIRERLTVLPEVLSARTICVYVSTPDEVETHTLIDWAKRRRKRVVVPCCRDNELHLFELRSMLELAPRTLGILEPREELRDVADRWITADQVEVFLVPGVAFDRNGGRLGHGKGYYDRLLARAAPATPKFALAFPWQLVDEIPMGPSDIRMDTVISE